MARATVMDEESGLADKVVMILGDGKIVNSLGT
jgi:hypothetical protein